MIYVASTCIYSICKVYYRFFVVNLEMCASIIDFLTSTVINFND